MASAIVGFLGRKQEAPTGEEIRITDLSNDALVIRLHFTINHLSRWLTPIHDQTRLTRAQRRGEPSVKDLLIQLRDHESLVFPRLHAIATRTLPDLDRLPIPVRTPAQVELDRRRLPLSILAEFRRLRQSTVGLLRGLPDDAWSKVGISRREHDWSIRMLAEQLAAHDLKVMADIDETLERTGAREGIAAAHRVRLPELLRLDPIEVRR